MRALHQVRPHETFVASGVYYYFEDEKPSGMVEHWSIYQLPDQSQIVRVDRDGRDSPSKTSLLIETLRSADGKIERCDIRFYYPNSEKKMQEARATYNFTDEHVEIGRILGSHERIDEVVKLPLQTVIYLLAHILTGDVIKRLAARENEKGFVFLPRIADLNDSQLLGGLVEERSAHFLGDETIDINGKVYATHHYQFIGGNYQESSSFWLDDHDVLVRYRYQSSDQHIWTTILKQYARRP
jgi:hypothetical protein